MSITYDAAIVGGGHNGLVTAAYLARAGRKVVGAGTARAGGRMRGHRRDLAGLSRLHRRLSDQPAAGAHHARAGPAALRLSAWTPRIRPSFRRFPTAAIFSCGRTARRRWRRSRNFRSAMPRCFPAYEDHLERLSQVVEGLLLTTPPQFPPRGSAISSII